MSLVKRELSAVLLVFGAVISVYMALLAGPISAQNAGDEGCANPEEVDTFSGTENQITPSFEITGNTFRLSYDIVDLDDDPGFDSITIRAIEEDGFQRGGVLVFDEGSGTENVLAGPGTFYLEIDSEGFEYTVTVEDCTGANGEVTDGEVTNGLIEDLREEVIINEPTVNKRNNPEPTVINIPNKPLPPTGGLPMYGMIAGSILAGAGLLGLGVGIRRGQRR